MSKAKECWLTATVIMLTLNVSAGLIYPWLGILLFVGAVLEFLRGGYYLLSR